MRSMPARSCAGRSSTRRSPRALNGAAAVHVIAAGKAASVMLDACASYGVTPRGDARRSVRRVRRRRRPAPSGTPAGTRCPTAGSVEGARRALALAAQRRAGRTAAGAAVGRRLGADGAAADGVTLAEKQQTVRRLLEAGADIHELNTVRKHLSAIKGGLLAAACRGRTLTLAVSDVVGDDLRDRVGPDGGRPQHLCGRARRDRAPRRRRRPFPPSVVRVCGGRRRRGAGDARAGTRGWLVRGPGDRPAARRRGRRAPGRRALGYAVHVVDEPVTGEARDAAAAHVARLVARVTAGRPSCVHRRGGETTVTVTGTRQGRPQSGIHVRRGARADPLGATAVAASVGTDGIDGPTDAAGAIADSTTFARARTAGIDDPDAYLRDNNTYAFFDRLGDLIKTGPTRTNVGDIQIVLVAEAEPFRPTSPTRSTRPSVGSGAADAR